MRAFVTMLVLLATASLAHADLPAEGWPQARRDAALSATSPESALTAPAIRWTSVIGESLEGEPALHGDQLHLLTDDGEAVAVHARSGQVRWRSTVDYALSPGPTLSSLALDAAGRLFAGRTAEPEAWLGQLNLRTLLTAIESYAIDENQYPPGPELTEVLTPTYIKRLPENLHEFHPMVHSDSPSPGDFRYERLSESQYYLGIWASDGGFLVPFGDCHEAPLMGHLGLAPSWPESAESGGRPTALAPEDGSLLWELPSGPQASRVTASLRPEGVIWATADSQSNHPSWSPLSWWPELAVEGLGFARLREVDASPLGRLFATDAEGDQQWELSFGGPATGSVARDPAGGSLFLALGRGTMTRRWMNQIRSLATGVESWSIDNLTYPETGELRPVLEPDHVPCWPSNTFTGEPIVHSATPSPGDYDYLKTSPDSYQLAIWGERGEHAVSFDTGSFTDWDGDESPSVISVAADGSTRWRSFFGATTEDPTPVALTSTGAVLVGTTAGRVRALEASDGSVRWEAELGVPLLRPPVVFADGGSAWVGTSGRLSFLDADGAVTATFWPGAEATAAASATEDGIVYLADREGSLHAVGRDGTERWSVELGGPQRVALSTTPLQVDDWIYVGRADGVLVAVVERDTGGVLAATGMMTARKPASGPGVLLDWSGISLSDAPGAHPHLRRWDFALRGPGTQLLAEGDSATNLLDDEGSSALAFYRLLTADSGENESRDR